MNDIHARVPCDSNQPRGPHPNDCDLLQPLQDTVSGGFDERIPSARLPSVELSPSSPRPMSSSSSSGACSSEQPGGGGGGEFKRDNGGAAENEPFVGGEHRLSSRVYSTT